MAQENVTEAFFAKSMIVKSSQIMWGPKIITKCPKFIETMRINSAKFSHCHCHCFMRCKSLCCMYIACVLLINLLFFSLFPIKSTFSNRRIQVILRFTSFECAINWGDAFITTRTFYKNKHVTNNLFICAFFYQTQVLWN